MTDYDKRVKQQIAQFADLGALWRPGNIMQYWMKTHIAPRVEAVFGAKGVFDVYANEFSGRIRAAAGQGRAARFVSIGSGDCQVEIRLVQRLKEKAAGPFVLVATELSDVRLQRGRQAAAEAGVAEHFEFKVVDLNDFRFDCQYDAIMAHHILHHIVNLEGLFEAIHAAMYEDSIFVTSDMIGRNGHQRWPETLEWIESLWPMLPSRYHFNYQFNKVHDKYLNWDCSNSGFEGIRAQDILPLLIKRFSFDGFVAYGGIVDPFVERGYGRNLDDSRDEDRAFIDFVEKLNQTLIEAGRIKPTQMLALMRRSGGRGRNYGGLTPERAVRVPRQGFLPRRSAALGLLQRVKYGPRTPAG